MNGHAQNDRALFRVSVAELTHTPLVCCHRICCGSDRTAHDDVIGADQLCLLRRHDALLIALIAVGKTHTRRYGQEFLAAAVVNLFCF